MPQQKIERRIRKTGTQIKKPLLIRVLVIGDRFEKNIDEIRTRVAAASKNKTSVDYCPNCRFWLSKMQLYASYHLVVLSWDKYSVLLAQFLRTMPEARAKLVLLSGIFPDPKNPSHEEIMGYGLFDYFISTLDPPWSEHTWQQVFDELLKYPPRRDELTLEKTIGYLAYRLEWRLYKPGHIGPLLANQGKENWTETWATRYMAFNLLPEIFAREVREMSGEIEARPIWGRPSFSSQAENRCFVIMPFKDPFNEIYQDHIKPAVEKLGLTCVRANDFYTTTPVMNDIWEAINNCAFLVAELTGRNSNVLYELGIAHTLGKEVILICQDESDVPFDFRHMRYYRYEYTPRGCKKLKNDLAKAGKELLTKK